MKYEGKVIKYGDNVDTDVIIPARYLNSSDPAELALHCMEDIDKEFVNKVKIYSLCCRNNNTSDAFLNMITFKNFSRLTHILNTSVST